MCDSMFPISPLSLATTVSFSIFFPTFSLLQTKFVSITRIRTAFYPPRWPRLSLPLFHPKSCGFSSLSLSCTFKTFLLPNDHFLSPPSSQLPRPPVLIPSLTCPSGLFSRDPLFLLVPAPHRPVSCRFGQSWSVDGIWMSATQPERAVAATTHGAPFFTAC